VDIPEGDEKALTTAIAHVGPISGISLIYFGNIMITN